MAIKRNKVIIIVITMKGKKSGEGKMKIIFPDKILYGRSPFNEGLQPISVASNPD